MRPHRGLACGLAMLVALVSACLFGPALLPASGDGDPRNAALLPPGTEVTALILDNRQTLMSPRVEREGDTWAVHGPRGVTRVKARRVVAERQLRLWLGSDRFGRDVLPFMVPRHRVMAHRFNESCVRGPGTQEAYWRDVGTLDAYWKANLDLTSITPALDLYDTEWPIWTYEPQRPAAKFLFDEGTRRGMATNSVVAAGCVVSGATVRSNARAKCSPATACPIASVWRPSPSNHAAAL
mgnify:CR=1 FL=1